LHLKQHEVKKNGIAQIRVFKGHIDVDDSGAKKAETMINEQKKRNQLKEIGMKNEVFRAIERGETNQVKDFVTKNILKLDDTDEFGNTLLNVAAQYGCFTTCNLLCRVGANINKPNYLGNTPLHHANEYKHMKLVDLLVENMADESIKNAKKLSPWEGI
jgi:hypothetical protein